MSNGIKSSPELAAKTPHASQSQSRVKVVLLLASLLGSTLLVFGAEEPGGKQKWVAPRAQAANKNPITANESSVTAGQKVYAKRCLECHGKTGNGDGPDAADLGIHPAKLSDPSTREQTDGELFWKITTGKKPMPSYGSRLSPTDRWNVINYLRTLGGR